MLMKVMRGPGVTIGLSDASVRCRSRHVEPRCGWPVHVEPGCGCPLHVGPSRARPELIIELLHLLLQGLVYNVSCNSSFLSLRLHLLLHTYAIASTIASAIASAIARVFPEHLTELFALAYFQELINYDLILKDAGAPFLGTPFPELEPRGPRRARARRG